MFSNCNTHTHTHAHTHTVMRCVEGLPPFESIDKYYLYRDNTARNVQFIPNYKFACYGKVARWGVFMRQHETQLDEFVEYNINFQVWRPERSGIEILNCYHFVGSNYFPGVFTESTGKFVTDIPEDQRIEVQPFDIIAVSVSDSMQYYYVYNDHSNLKDNIRMWSSETDLTPNHSTAVCLERYPDPTSNLTTTFDPRPLIAAVVGKSNIVQQQLEIGL